MGVLRRGTSRFPEARSVGENLNQGEIRGLSGRGPKIPELGQILRHGIRDLQLSLILEHEHRDRSDRLGHRSDPEKGVRRHGPARGDVGMPGAFQVQNAIRRDHQRESAGDLAFFNLGLHRIADTGKLSGGGLGGKDEAHGGE